jgi:hypothetical protein
MVETLISIGAAFAVEKNIKKTATTTMGIAKDVSDFLIGLPPYILI